jgi:phosphoribosylaminoimidazolecarboxamide formyltransferase/IMP cyclohydrolase
MTKYALISVSDKTGIETIAVELERLGYTILSTSSTARHLKQFCKVVVEVSDLTGFPEILGGRVKTLHPKIHAGILADRSNPDHTKIMKDLQIDHIDIVVVNLYPFAKVLADPTSTKEQIIENIDIGGPALLRAAAKNHRHVVVLTHPNDYQPTLDYLRDGGEVPLSWKINLAFKAFAKVSHYDADIADFLEEEHAEGGIAPRIPAYIDLSCTLHYDLRYGENPHQRAGFYTDRRQGWDLVHGKVLSFNNLLDIDAALRAIRLYNEPTVIIFKHTNPCGIGSGFSLADAYRKAFATDTISPYGGIVVVNKPLDLETAVMINKIFTEIIIAPAYQEGVLEVLQKKKDRRLIRFDPEFIIKPSNPFQLRALTWGYLVQDWDLVGESIEDWRVVTRRQPSTEEFEAMIFGWKSVSYLNSNAVVLVGKDRAMGMGFGQTSRVDSTTIAIMKAIKFKHDLSKAVCASDGFFPFRDSIDELYQNGVKAVIQPGGSKGDEEVIRACDELDIAMVFTGVRHFKH